MAGPATRGHRVGNSSITPVHPSDKLSERKQEQADALPAGTG